VGTQVWELRWESPAADAVQHLVDCGSWMIKATNPTLPLTSNSKKNHTQAHT